MTLKECFNSFSGDYDGVMSRMGKEERIQKFLLKFKADPTFNLLTESLAAENYEEAFRAAHTIKGLCQNLGFSLLYNSSYALTEALRNGQKPDDDSIFQQVKKDYEQIIKAIDLLDK